MVWRRRSCCAIISMVCWCWLVNTAIRSCCPVAGVAWCEAIAPAMDSRPACMASARAATAGFGVLAGDWRGGSVLAGAASESESDPSLPGPSWGGFASRVASLSPRHAPAIPFRVAKASLSMAQWGSSRTEKLLPVSVAALLLARNSHLSLAYLSLTCRGANERGGLVAVKMAAQR